MANRSQYPNRSWKIYRNTPSFVPKPGDIAVWTYGWAGHTAIVVGPSDKKNFKCVECNWLIRYNHYKEVVIWSKNIIKKVLLGLKKVSIL